MSFLSRVQKVVRKVLRKPPLPDDPFAKVPVPAGGGPKPKAGAVALQEPEDDLSTFHPPRRQDTGR